MPAGVVAGYFRYPGIGPLIGGEYTVSHGVTPGTILLRTHPNPVAPVNGGNVKIGDGRKELTVPGCKLIRFTAERSDSGIEWLLELEDERWKWRDGSINGFHNQLDSHGKLIPRTIKSPTELAHLCLDRMGVERRFVDMPDGIPGALTNNIPDFLPNGINFPPLGINPPVNWFAENPAQALSALAESCGRRVVYDPVDRRVLVVRPGIGDDLPNGHIANVTPSMVAPETPDAVQVVGDPTRTELFFELQAVGLEWDGSIKPINELSYAPDLPAKVHICTYEVTKLGPDGTLYGFTISRGGLRVEDFTCATNPGDTMAIIVETLRDAVNATVSPDLAGNVRASATATKVFVSGTKSGFLFDMIDRFKDGLGSVVINEAGAEAGRGWDYSPAPSFPNIKSTPRLTRLQALQLAQRSVFRMFRLTGRDAATLKPPIMVPGIGPVVRQDIVLLDELCEQVVPEAGDRRVVDRDGLPLIRSQYDGYSRSKPAEVYGSVCSTCINNGETWFIGSGTVTAGGAALGRLVPPSARIMTFEIKKIVNGTSYNITFNSPDMTEEAYVFYAPLPGDTITDIITELKTQILAIVNPVLGGKFSVVDIANRLVISNSPASIGFLFRMKTDTAAELAAVATLETGHGAPPAAPPPPVGPATAASDEYTPPGNVKGASINTDPSDRVYVDFTVDPTWQTITFKSAVWFAGAGLVVQEPRLFLRAACHVKNAFTQQLVAFQDTQVFRPGPAVHIARRPDVQLNVIGKYKITNFVGGDDEDAMFCWKLKDTRLLEQDAVIRARAYLIAELLQFQIKGGLTVEYNGIEPIRLDGKTQQVSYRVEGGVGTMTTASTNMEHSTWVPPFPARRRAENLASVARHGTAGGRPGAGRDDPADPSTGDR